MKCADIDDKEVLQVLADNQGKWSSHIWGPLDAFFKLKKAPYKIALGKMRQLHKRGFVGGCTCGCRGDWEITDKGLAFIGVKRTASYGGYGERKDEKTAR